MKYMYVIFSALMFCLPLDAFAAISITEIMYDLEGADTNREWVEVCAFGESVPILDWKFNDGANHSINEPPENGSVGSMEIKENDCVILAAHAETFLAEHPGFDTTVLDTVMNLNNSGDTLSLITTMGAVAASATYTAYPEANGTGKSLQLAGSDFTPQEPTPGAMRIVDESETQGVTFETLNSVSSKKENTEVLPPTIMAIELNLPKQNIAGVPINLKPKVYGYSGELLTTGYFTYNFGNGDIVTRSSVREPEVYTYFYPGEYLVSLEYRRNEYKLDPDIYFEQVISVTEPGVYITHILPDGAIVLENSTTKEVSVQGFSLQSGTLLKKFDGRTVIRPKKTITVSPLMPGTLVYTQPVTLIDPSGKVLDQYPKQTVQTSVGGIKTTADTRSSRRQIIDTSSQGNDFSNSGKTVGEQVSESKKTKKYTLLYAFIASIGTALLGAGSFLYLRKKNAKEENSEASGYSIVEISEP